MDREFTMQVRMDNVAFEDHQDGTVELARILRAVANRLTDGGGVCMDFNGNRVGKWGISDGE